MLSQPQVSGACGTGRKRQSDHLRPCVLPPAGQSGVGVQAEQSGGRHLHGFSPGGREQLRGGERGWICIHRLSSWEVGVLKTR